MGWNVQRVHLDDNKYHVEKFGALPVLKKVKLKGFSDSAT